MARIRVMIVEDSAAVRALLEHIVAEDGRFEVVASVASAEEGLERLERAAPDVISLDIRLPGMNGFEFTRQVMRTRPTPIVVISASIDGGEPDIAMEALRAGALSVMEKPPSPTSREYEPLAARICNQLALMSDVRVVRQYPSRPRKQRPTSSPAVTAVSRTRNGYRAVGIVASTGGPNAVLQVLTGLGRDFPLPVFLVQHITASFLQAYVAWLDRLAPLPVVEAGHGLDCRPGVVHVAPPDHHLEVRQGRTRLVRGDREDYQCPSGSVLLRSLAGQYGAGAIGIVLTGMGRDGAVGLKAIREAGGLTIVEHESTCVIYGMPAAACALGAAGKVLPLPGIAACVRESLVAGLAGEAPT